MDPMGCNVSDVEGLQGTHNSPHSFIVAYLRPKRLTQSLDVRRRR